MARYYCIHASHAFIFYMRIYLACISFLACASALHVLIFLPVAFLLRRVFLPNWACVEQACNTNILTRLESLPNSCIHHCLCQCFVPIYYPLVLLLSLDTLCCHGFDHLYSDWHSYNLAPLQAYMFEACFRCVDLHNQLFFLFL
jgi:hypothetical protein